MKITTNEFSLTRSDYFKILVSNALRNRWFVFILFLLVSAIGTKMTTESLVSHCLFFFLVCIIYFIYLLVLCAIQSWLLRGNQFFFVSQRCEIDHEFIAAYLPDGSLNKINFAHITKTIMKKNYFLFYYSRNQFIYLPLKAMNNAEDLQALLTLVKVKFS